MVVEDSELVGRARGTIMIDIHGPAVRRCDGVTRRGLLKVGMLGLAGLGLPDLLRAEAVAKGAGGPSGRDLSVILVWLDGGPPQHETYDPKPDAPAEFRGPLGTIATKLPGVRVSELMPGQARLMDKMSLLRSVHHDNDDHFAAAHWMLTGYLGPNGVNQAPKNPSVGSVVARLKGARRAGMPAYVGLPNTHSVGLAPGYHGGAYLGVAANPFSADGDPNSEGYGVPNLALPAGVDPPRAAGRRALLTAFDGARRVADASGMMSSLDRFQREAFDMVTGPAARAAFDLRREDPRLRDRYGRHTWGQSALLARRLVEAGVRFVTLTYGDWDMHSSLDKAVRRSVPVLDNAVSTLIADLDSRGLLDTTMVVVMGEFGRTPRINKGGVPGSDPVPGRDHWGRLMSVMMAGGGLTPGLVIGSSNARGEAPKERPIRPEDIAVTLYRKLGIDPETTFTDRTDRPITIGSNGTAIEELL